MTPNIISGNCFHNRCFVNGLLQKGQFLKSNNGKTKFIFQENGNLEILCGSYPIWSSGTSGPDIDTLYFNNEGKLVILNKDKSTAKNIMSSSGNTTGAEKLILQDDGNLVTYSNDNQPWWSTGTNEKCITSKTKPLFSNNFYSVIRNGRYCCYHYLSLVATSGKKLFHSFYYFYW